MTADLFFIVAMICATIISIVFIISLTYFKIKICSLEFDYHKELKRLDIEKGCKDETMA